MIPAILAAPMVQGVVGGVVGGVMNCFAPSAPATPTASFNPYIDRVAKPTVSTAIPLPTASTTSPSGTLRAQEWNNMNTKDVQTWANGLAGRHVDATDDSGRTISGIVGGMTQLGHTLALNIGGHFVSLSQLKQISWSSPAV